MMRSDETGLFAGQDSHAFDTVKAPRWPVLLALVLALVSGGLLALEAVGGQASQVAFSAAGYLVGSIGVSGAIVVHRMLSQRAQQNVRFEPRHGLAVMARLALVLGLALGAGNAFFLATELAKR